MIAGLAFIILAVAGLSAIPTAAQYRRETISTANQWSPNHGTLATIETNKSFGTPEGGNSCLYFNMQPVYPNDCTPSPKVTWRHVHAFFTDPLWSSDGTHVALVEKIFDWEYDDPYGRYFDGEATSIRYYLVIAGVDRTVLGYPVAKLGPSFSKYSYTYEMIPEPELRWQGNSQLILNGQTYDLAAHPPDPIP